MLYQRKIASSIAILAISILTISSKEAYSSSYYGNYSTSPFLIDNQSFFSDIKTRWDFGTEARKADFNWNIASDLTGQVTPNILSELSYKNLSITQGTGSVTFQKTRGLLSGLSLETQLSAGTVASGNAQDSDYSADNRADEYNRSISNLQGSSIVNTQAALGYPLFQDSHHQIRALAGYAFNEQNFIKTQGRQIISNNKDNNLAAYNNLDSSYDAQWQGPWVGGTWSWQQSKHQLGLRVEQHWPSYYAQADWNLREELAHPKSFDQQAKGQGQVLELNYSYALTKQLHLNLKAHHESWKTGAGVDTLYYAAGGTAQTRLNGASWNSDGVSVGVIFQ